MDIISNILIVDDDSNVRIVLSDILQYKGYNVFSAETGAKALKIINDTSFDVILLDVNLGDMTGMEVLEKVKNIKPDVECIVLTAYSSQDIVMEAINLGAYGYMEKPCDMEQLLIMIRRAIEKRRASDDLRMAHSILLQNEKMAAIGQLAAGVAHEINNPVGFISGNLRALDKYINKLVNFIEIQSEVIKKSNCPEFIEEITNKKKELKINYITEDVKDLIKESLNGTERISTIVKNLKSFSRIDKEYSTLDINECIENTLDIVWNELKYKGTVKKEYGNIPETKGYEQQLSQVFMNLLVNASHAIKEYGEIKIKTQYEDDSIFISISDTGCGIPKEHYGKIFDPFFTTKEAGKGTGLGLGIVYDIIKQHKGDIVFQSEVGKGTIFTVCLPVVK